jgi:hypothetical protein
MSAEHRRAVVAATWARAADPAAELPQPAHKVAWLVAVSACVLARTTRSLPSARASPGSKMK